MGLGAFKKLTSLGAGLFNQSTAPIAVDFGVGSLKVLQVQAGEAPSLIAAACLETPVEIRGDQNRRLEFQLAAFSRMVRQGGFKGRRAVCAIPASHTFCKHIQLPRAEGQAMADQVAMTISGQLQCDPGALVYRHIVVETPAAGAGKVEVITFATPRDLVMKLLGALREARLEPVGMHSEFSSVLRSFDYVNRRADDQGRVTLYLDVGSGSTKVMIAHGPEMVFARLVELGGRHLDEEIVKRTKCDLREAGRIRWLMEDPAPGRKAANAAAPGGGMALLAAGMRSAGAEPSPAVATAPAVAFNEPDLTEPLEILTDEVQLSLRYHENLFPGKRVERLVFVGGESKHKGLCQHIARVLRLPAQLADPMARVSRTGREPGVGVELKEPQPGWAVALGLCLSPTDL